MSTMTVQDSNWSFEQTVANAGTITALLETENKFLDKNIGVKITTPAADSPLLSITDNPTGSFNFGTLTNNYYPLSTTLEGTFGFTNSGWATGSYNKSATAVVGRIAKSSFKSGSSDISGSTYTVTPLVDNSSTITIGAGYYPEARTITVSPMSGEGATSAAATVSVTGTTDNPTLSHINSSISTKTQITVSPSTSSSVISKYYIAVKASAPTTEPTFTTTIGTAGYLGAISQITTSGSITGSDATYYIPLDTATFSRTDEKIFCNGSGYVAANTSTAILSVPLASITAPDTTVDTVAFTYESTSGKFKLTGNKTQTAISVGTAGFISSGKGTKTVGTAYVSTTVDKISLNGTITNNGAVKPTINNVTSAVTDKIQISTTPVNNKTSLTSTYYLAVQAPASAKTITVKPTVSSEGYGTTSDYNFSNVSVTAGSSASDIYYLPLTSSVLSTGTSIPAGTQENDWQTETSTVVPSGGYLFIKEGYIKNTRISLATLVPDGTTDKPAAASYILAGYKAYDNNGNLITGSIATYAGEYQIVTG